MSCLPQAFLSQTRLFGHKTWPGSEFLPLPLEERTEGSPQKKLLLPSGYKCASKEKERRYEKWEKRMWHDCLCKPTDLIVFEAKKTVIVLVERHWSLWKEADDLDCLCRPKDLIVSEAKKTMIVLVERHWSLWQGGIKPWFSLRATGLDILWGKGSWHW